MLLGNCSYVTTLVRLSVPVPADFIPRLHCCGAVCTVLSLPEVNILPEVNALPEVNGFPKGKAFPECSASGPVTGHGFDSGGQRISIRALNAAKTSLCALVSLLFLVASMGFDVVMGPTGRAF